MFKILDIVIIWPKVPCPRDYHYIQYVLYYMQQSMRTRLNNLVLEKTTLLLHKVSKSKYDFSYRRHTTQLHDGCYTTCIYIGVLHQSCKCCCVYSSSLRKFTGIISRISTIYLYGTKSCCYVCCRSEIRSDTS